MSDRPRPWSVSAHRAYRACPRMWWLTSVAKVPQESREDSNRGVVLHAGLAAGYAEHARARREGAFPVVVRRRVGAAVDFAVSRESARLDYDEVDEAYDTVMECLHHLGPRERDVVLGVERELRIEVDGVEIVYRADVIYRRDGVVTVRDWKSASEVPRERDLRTNRQLVLGALCAARIFDTTRVAVEIASIGRGVAVGIVVDAAAARAAGEAVADSARAAAQDEEFDPTPGEVCASCRVRRYCPVFAPVGERTPTPRRSWDGLRGDLPDSERRLP